MQEFFIVFAMDKPNPGYDYPEWFAKAAEAETLEDAIALGKYACEHSDEEEFSFAKGAHFVKVEPVHYVMKWTPENAKKMIKELGL